MANSLRQRISRIERQILDRPLGGFKCPSCFRVTATVDELLNHYRTARGYKALVRPQRVYPCLLKKDGTPDLRHDRAHVLAAKLASEEKRPFKRFSVTTDGYRCEWCGRLFEEPEGVLAHYGQAHAKTRRTPENRRMDAWEKRAHWRPITPWLMA